MVRCFTSSRISKGALNLWFRMICFILSYSRSDILCRRAHQCLSKYGSPAPPHLWYSLNLRYISPSSDFLSPQLLNSSGTSIRLSISSKVYCLDSTNFVLWSSIFRLNLVGIVNCPARTPQHRSILQTFAAHRNNDVYLFPLRSELSANMPITLQDLPTKLLRQNVKHLFGWNRRCTCDSQAEKYIRKPVISI